MKKINKHNPYGYKIGYRENGNRFFVCHFLNRTYKDAKRYLELFTKYPTYTHTDLRLIENSTWEIRPIRFSEFAKGIWKESPF